jgi:hypothetical protein
MSPGQASPEGGLLDNFQEGGVGLSEIQAWCWKWTEGTGMRQHGSFKELSAIQSYWRIMCDKGYAGG